MVASSSGDFFSVTAQGARQRNTNFQMPNEGLQQFIALQGAFYAPTYIPPFDIWILTFDILASSSMR
jgi:hypothetical protein